jgi:FKBP-type peptidyl-prolyl cis-trans isomerase
MQMHLVHITIALLLTFGTIGYSQDDPTQGAQKQPTGAQGAVAKPDPAIYHQQVSYALGQNFAQNLRDNEIEIDLNALVAGINDVMTNAQPKWTQAELERTMRWFSQDMQQKAMARIKGEAAKNKQQADNFLAQNTKREGVQATASGLQYIVLQKGDGPSPTVNDTVRCNYRGTLLNGTEFDSSARHGGPAEFKIAPGLIPGWIEALQKMHVGEKWQLFVPPNLAYGMDPPGPPIEANSLLVFEIELLEILPE